jgi:hypothetical protein
MLELREFQLFSLIFSYLTPSCKRLACSDRFSLVNEPCFTEIRHRHETDWIVCFQWFEGALKANYGILKRSL